MGDAGVDFASDGWDDPEAYLAGDRRRAIGAGLTMPERVQGAADGSTRKKLINAAPLAPSRSKA